MLPGELVQHSELNVIFMLFGLTAGSLFATLIIIVIFKPRNIEMKYFYTYLIYSHIRSNNPSENPCFS